MLELKHISKRINQKIIFEDLSLTISTGDLVAITGPSGCGKSSLLNILGFIDSDFTGLYTFNGQTNIKANSSKAQRLISQDISYLFQNFALIENETVYYNLLLALKYVKQTKAEKQAAIATALADVGLKEKMTQKVSDLSGGEQQRVAIARAILKPSQLILADEPTGSLDADNRDIIIQLLKELNQQGKTIVIVTHDPFVVEACSKVIRLDAFCNLMSSC